MGTIPPARLRADARRNRDRILRAAVTVFAQDGPYVPMDEIARLAAVGVGTLYRHFPDREALILAVVRASLAAMAARARAAQAEERCAWDAMLRSLRGSPELRLTLCLPDRFLPATAEVIRADPEIRRIRGELVGQIEDLVQAARQEGTLRPDVGAGDVIHLFSTLLHVVHRMPAETAEAVYERSWEIVLDGLRARPGEALPGRALTAADVTAGFSSR
ncbi:transcriptional regulator [Frankia sp. EI5c]|uniref:TetR/AcrR family transcriptional regulator n=1 Tax=Frankia sp. EI5c TaxID=683316 RepID=UPI0007C3C17B|nr:TetR/AcrR family transcriptional regulator [Frankia sp. EI5c]OAA18934.1 transcriptional regulator [Frankia sp. EI5c]